MKENTVLTACRSISSASETLKQDINSLSTDDIEMLDITMKELVTVRSIIDFKMKTQLTQTNWREIKESIS